MAYCRWLSQRLGQDVRLPTEWEWQQAACHGNPNNTYPWGSDWQERRCNSDESQLNRTIAVGLYAQDWPDDRPIDMAGNVWEWCLNEYAKPMPLNKIILGGSAERTLRGGSWLNRSDFLRCAIRYRLHPLNRFNYLGFRLVLGSPW
jgi:formylglycine-generating enzyme required for sulfatase activity